MTARFTTRAKSDLDESILGRPQLAVQVNNTTNGSQGTTRLSKKCSYLDHCFILREPSKYKRLNLLKKNRFRSVFS